MAIVRQDCPSCGTKIDVTLGQSIHDGRLVWWKEYFCPHCGARMEEDGRGAPAEPDRQAILEQDGEWCLIVENSSGTPAMIALKVLREELNLSLTETGNLRKLLPGPILAGTRIEMERLVRVLKKKGINSSTKQITTDVVKQ